MTSQLSKAQKLWQEIKKNRKLAHDSLDAYEIESFYKTRDEYKAKASQHLEDCKDQLQFLNKVEKKIEIFAKYLVKLDIRDMADFLLEVKEFKHDEGRIKDLQDTIKFYEEKGVKI